MPGVDMRLAQVENGVVVNVIEVNPENRPTFTTGWPEAGDAGPGWVVDGDGFAPPTPPAPTPAEVRASMPPISPLQGILTLGETEWGKVLAFRDGVDEDGEPLATWQQKVIIDNASDWVRTSQNIAFFGFLLNYTPEQMDTLFIAATQVRA